MGGSGRPQWAARAGRGSVNSIVGLEMSSRESAARVADAQLFRVANMELSVVQKDVHHPLDVA